MGRILAMDFGIKRTGVAVTDPLKIIASPLETVETKGLLAWLKLYLAKEEVECLVVGLPMNEQMEDSHSTEAVKKWLITLNNQLPKLKVETVDERYTTRIAQQAMIDGGMKKSKRRQKGEVDKVSATLILQTYLETNY